MNQHLGLTVRVMGKAFEEIVHEGYYRHFTAVVQAVDCCEFDNLDTLSDPDFDPTHPSPHAPTYIYAST